MTGLERFVDVTGGGFSIMAGAIFCGVSIVMFCSGLALIWGALLYGK